MKVLYFGSKDYTKDLKMSSAQVFWDRLANFSQLGPISDSRISPKLQNGINDPKGPENKIYTMMKGMGTFYGYPFTVAKISPRVEFELGRLDQKASA